MTERQAERQTERCRICGEGCDPGRRYAGLCRRCGSKREEYAKALLSAAALGELRGGGSVVTENTRTSWRERVRARLVDVFALAEDAVRVDEGVE